MGIRIESSVKMSAQYLMDIERRKGIENKGRKKDVLMLTYQVCGVCKSQELSTVSLSPCLRKDVKEQKNPYKHSKDIQSKAGFCMDRSRWFSLETKPNGSKREHISSWLNIGQLLSEHEFKQTSGKSKGNASQCSVAGLLWKPMHQDDRSLHALRKGLLQFTEEKAETGFQSP